MSHNPLFSDPLFGMPVRTIPTEWESVQFRRPKSKSRRIRKKWRGRRCNWKTIPRNICYQADLPDGLVWLVPQHMLPKLMRELKAVDFRKDGSI